MFNIFKSRNNIILKSPFRGRVVNLDDVPDKVFSERMVGDGIAIKPESNYLLAPIAGEIIQLFSTNHALGLRTERGLEVLLHLGIDSVELGGKGFTALVEEKQKINPGTKLIKIDWELIEKEIASTICPIIITNMEMVKDIEVLAGGCIETGDDLLLIKV